MEVNVIMPMLGGGTRMQGVQNTFKPLMRFKNGEYFFIRALKSLVNYKINRLVLVVLQEYSQQFYDVAQKIVDNVGCKRMYIISHEPTKTPVETLKIGLDGLIGETLPIISLDCDIYGELPIISNARHGGIFYFRDDNPNKSFIRTHCGYVTEIAEKIPISDKAVFGAYMFTDVKMLKDVLISRNVLCYISDVMKSMLYEGALIGAAEVQKVYNYGTLKELQHYEDEKL